MLKPEKYFSKNSNLINLIGILSAIILLGSCYTIRDNLLPFITPIDYISVLSLVIIVLSGPDYLNKLVFQSRKWYHSIEFNTILLLLFFGVTGFLLTNNFYWIRYITIIPGLYLFARELILFFSKPQWFSLLIGVFFIGFVYALFFTQGYHSFLFPEKIILGNAHIDVLFHASINSLFSTLGYASTGLDGAPYLNYHWGSHALFAGLKGWIGVNSIIFYNIAYPVIFIPLFFKAFFLFIENICEHINKSPFSLILVSAGIVLFYSIGFIGFSEANAIPMVSESFSVSLVFSFLYGSIIYKYAGSVQYGKYLFWILSIVILFVIFLFKLSTGFAVFIGIAYLLIRSAPSVRNILVFLVVTTIFSVLIYEFLYPPYRIDNNISPGNQLLNYWKWSTSFITYMLGILLFTFVLLLKTKGISFKKFKIAIFSRKYLEYEVIAVINLVTGLGAVMVASNAVDVYYFFGTQFFLSLAYIFALLHKDTNVLGLTKNTTHILAIFIITFSFIGRPDIITGILNNQDNKKDYLTLSDEQKILKEYVLELNNIQKTINRRSTCIYIDKNQKWYYRPDNQTFKEIFITPSISGIVTIQSIPDFLFDAGFKYFSIGYYRPSNDIDPISKARACGFEQMLIYKEVDNMLNRKLINLSE